MVFVYLCICSLVLWCSPVLWCLRAKTYNLLPQRFPERRPCQLLRYCRWRTEREVSYPQDCYCCWRGGCEKVITLLQSLIVLQLSSTYICYATPIKMFVVRPSLLRTSHRWFKVAKFLLVTFESRGHWTNNALLKGQAKAKEEPEYRDNLEGECMYW